MRFLYGRKVWRLHWIGLHVVSEANPPIKSSRWYCLTVDQSGGKLYAPPASKLTWERGKDCCRCIISSASKPFTGIISLLYLVQEVSEFTRSSSNNSISTTAEKNTSTMGPSAWENSCAIEAKFRSVSCGNIMLVLTALEHGPSCAGRRCKIEAFVLVDYCFKRYGFFEKRMFTYNKSSFLFPSTPNGSLRCHETSRMPCLCAHENSTLITDLG